MRLQIQAKRIGPRRVALRALLEDRRDARLTIAQTFGEKMGRTADFPVPEGPDTSTLSPSRMPPPIIWSSSGMPQERRRRLSGLSFFPTRPKRHPRKKTRIRTASPAPLRENKAQSKTHKQTMPIRLVDIWFVITRNRND